MNVWMNERANEYASTFEGSKIVKKMKERKKKKNKNKWNKCIHEEYYLNLYFVKSNMKKLNFVVKSNAFLKTWLMFAYEINFKWNAFIADRKNDVQL